MLILWFSQENFKAAALALSDIALNSSFDLSLKYLEARQTQESKDALQLLSIVGFFHFEHIRVDIFTRALENRVLDKVRNR